MREYVIHWDSLWNGTSFDQPLPSSGRAECSHTSPMLRPSSSVLPRTEDTCSKRAGRAGGASVAASPLGAGAFLRRSGVWDLHPPSGRVKPRRMATLSESLDLSLGALDVANMPNPAPKAYYKGVTGSRAMPTPKPDGLCWLPGGIPSLAGSWWRAMRLGESTLNCHKGVRGQPPRHPAPRPASL